MILLLSLDLKVLGKDAIKFGKVPGLKSLPTLNPVKHTMIQFGDLIHFDSQLFQTRARASYAFNM